MSDARPSDADKPTTTASAYHVTWERWDEVDALFERAMDVPKHRRERFLFEASADDPELCSAVLELFAAGKPGLSEPSRTLMSAALGEPASDPRPGLAPGERLGPYRIVSELGRGGMATVYEAERADGAFSRRVAVKVLPEGVDRGELVRRSLAERQILSGLAHPNIATLLDGGATPDGRPFLVMELVEGESITRWADEKRLSTGDRVRLFLQVVDAVTYAHGQLVVHRDLKPSNVLVTSTGQVKLLDFGVAKLLDAPESLDDPLTRWGPAPMTPEYASPEQLRGERVTATSDVFQLGVLLYRLLTGGQPFDGRTIQSRLAGGEVAVTRPSEAVSDWPRARGLRGDLDTIVLKALEPDPGGRYGSAAALAADLRRQLEGRPIAARPASPWVILKKFSRRNPWFWPVAATMAIGVGGYVGTVVRYSGGLERERNEAVSQAERAEAMRAFMVSQFGLADPYSDDPVNPQVTVVEAMSRGAEEARRELGDQPLLQAEMLSAIAQVYGNLSLSEDARILVDEAMTIRHASGADSTPEQVADLGRLRAILGNAGQRDSARVVLRKRLEMERTLFGGDHPRTAEALEGLGWHWYEDGEFAQALEWYEEAVQIRRGAEPRDVADLSASLAALADSYRSVGRWEEAQVAAREGYEISLGAFGEEHAITAGNKGHLAQVVHGMGDLEQAILLYREALPVLERTLGEQHAHTLANWNNLGIVLAEADDLDGAEEVQRRILALRRDRYSTDEHYEVGTSLQNLASLLVRGSRLAEADSLARQAEGIFRAVVGDGHYTVAFSLITQSEAALRRGQGAHAERIVRHAIQILEPQFGTGFPTAAARCRLGRAIALQGRGHEAEPLLVSSLEAMESAGGVPERELTACRDAWDDLQVSRGG